MPREPLRPAMRGWAGIRNTVEPERLGPRDLADAVNVDLDDTGRATRRPGQSSLLAGAVHSVWTPGPDEEPCLCVQDGALKRLNADYSTTILGTGLSDARMAYVKVDERVYHTNGEITGIYDGGAVRSWGIPIPDAPHGVAALGQMPAGKYLYTMTRWRADDQESGAALANSIELDENGAIAFTWTPVSGRVALYVSPPNGETMYRAALVDGSLGAYTVAGVVKAIPLTTQFMDSPLPGQDLTDHNGRIYTAVGPYIFATQPLAYELCDFRDYVALDGTRVQFVVGVDAGLFAGTELATYFLAGGSFEALARRTVVASRGVAGSAIRVNAIEALGAGNGKVAMFTTGEGVYIGMPDGSARNITHERYDFAPPETAAAVLRRTPLLTQYIVTA